MTTRLNRIDSADLIGAAAELYSRYTTGERAKPGASFSLITADGQLTGPPATWMLNPDLGLRMEQLGYGVRFELTLSPRYREIVILMVAEREDSPFERYAHHQAARQAGLTFDEIAMLDAGDFMGVDEREQVLITTTKAIFACGALTAAEWDAAEKLLGRSAILEIVTLVGWYRLMALQLRVFEIEPPS
ncbi:carboxymuconolactone decarboxylase family protein [Microbacterium sp.]|uniref:carboxymuconolactone decarboxylase family protein n=1 Tax=Microbacterium sp. TaxID=51671 RepID=UPI002733088D|nr:carboxymuconolactone decarboxylase family protein [Microbacterium sp.]MDP3951835.1 carboxymuconolactone decarboxylase family protein [Microbacterium sp.]